MCDQGGVKDEHNGGITAQLEQRVPRSLGLAATVFILVAYVVGASLFILPGTLGAITGPGLFIAYLIAAIPALFGCVVIAQISCAYPSSGGSYRIVSELISPFAGAIISWLLILLAVLAMPLLALGFADYIRHFFPTAPLILTAATAIALFAAINMLGVQTAAGIQSALVLVFVLLLLAFGIGGISTGSAEQLSPLLPNGWEPLLAVSVTLYFSYSGITVLPEMAGEIKQPHKTIPRAIIIGFGLIIILYLLVAIALMMTLPWQALGGSAAIAKAAAQIFPYPGAEALAICALLAAGTSVSGVLMAQSRDVLVAAQKGVLPRYFGKINPRSQVPVRAIGTLAILAMAALGSGSSIKQYADTMVLGLMVVQILLGLAVYRLPTVRPDIYQRAKFKIKPAWLKGFAIGLILFSLAMLLKLLLSNGWAALYMAVFVALGMGIVKLEKTLMRKL